MRTIVGLNDDLVAKAQAFTEVHEKAGLLREALKALAQHDSTRRFARLRGSAPNLKPASCRQTDSQ